METRRSSRPGCLRLAIAASVAAGATLAIADERQRPLSALSLEELLRVKVSVASQTEEQLRAAPSSVTVFTRDEIRDLGVASLQELLNYVPGFQTARDVEQGTADRIASRGRSTALSESVLFLINGQRVNDLYTGGVSILDRLFAVGNIKQVEVVRGPGSALYGSNAFLGVVNIVTLAEANDVTLSVGDLGSRAVECLTVAGPCRSASTWTSEGSWWFCSDQDGSRGQCAAAYRSASAVRVRTAARKPVARA